MPARFTFFLYVIQRLSTRCGCPSLNVGLTSVTSDAARSETVRRVGGTGVRACNGGCWRPCFWSYRGTQAVASNLVFGVESAGARSWRAWVCGNLRPLLLDLGLTSHLARGCFRTPQLSAIPLSSPTTTLLSRICLPPQPKALHDSKDTRRHGRQRRQQRLRL